MQILAVTILILFGAKAQADSLKVSCAKALMGIEGVRTPQAANKTPLVELGGFRSIFKPRFGDLSWKPVQAQGLGGDSEARRKIENAAVSDRLNALYADLDRKEVNVYSSRKVGREEIEAYLNKVGANNQIFANAVNDLWRSRMQAPIQYGTALPAVAGLLPLSIFASAFSESLARLAVSAIAVPVVATGLTVAARRAQRDPDLTDHLKWVAKVASMSPEDLKDKMPYSFYSQNIKVPRALFEEMLLSSGDESMMHTLAADYMARNPVNVMTGVARHVVARRYDIDQPEMVTVDIDQMLAVDDGALTLVTYVRQTEENPPDVHRTSDTDNDGRSGGGGRRVRDLENSRALQLQPAPIRVRPGDRR